ncbi:MAG: hypothetical protein GWO41_16630 [candidate division Zixibacteria bacterium]|nr:hypothetical protein [candidate division Zixibacteria bacterium]NIR63547.1 hypothetical protein [candidate division Zixibacteria bacterium]NIS18038.1 hypothetical protein [candidate division Zixibacteria bacterium]NIS45493.1 hypothetical protein [candidate division Zixibacteria bacterium]NIT54318.1 hypothetical protein [candidate division Zixibacteria bacterium]
MKLRKRYRAVFAALSIIFLLTLVLSCGKGLEGKIKAYEDAINSHDVEAVLAFYAEPVTIEMGRVSSPLTETELRPLAEWDSIVNTEVSFTVKETRGDTVYCTKTETNDWYKAFTIDTLYFDPWIAVFEDGKIRQITYVHTPESIRRMAEAYKSFYDWAYEERPIKLKELMPEGQPIRGVTSAKKWMEILTEWREETGGI